MDYESQCHTLTGLFKLATELELPLDYSAFHQFLVLEVNIKLGGIEEAYLRLLTNNHIFHRKFAIDGICHLQLKDRVKEHVSVVQFFSNLC